MNKLVEKLMMDATDTPHFNERGWYWPPEYVEKFAELIVRECIAQCNDGDSRYFIATHFGVK